MDKRNSKHFPIINSIRKKKKKNKENNQLLGMFNQKRNSMGEVERRRKKEQQHSNNPLLLDNRKVPRSANASPNIPGYGSHGAQHMNRPNTAANN